MGPIGCPVKCFQAVANRSNWEKTIGVATISAGRDTKGEVSVGGVGGFAMVLFILWYVFIIIQMFMGYGTAYRKTKANGDNGVALFGWMIVYNLAAMIPGLGIYLWNKSKE